MAIVMAGVGCQVLAPETAERLWPLLQQIVNCKDSISHLFSSYPQQVANLTLQFTCSVRSSLQGYWNNSAGGAEGAARSRFTASRSSVFWMAWLLIDFYIPPVHIQPLIKCCLCNTLFPSSVQAQSKSVKYICIRSELAYQSMSIHEHINTRHRHRRPPS